MKKTLFVLSFCVLLFPSVSSAAALTNDQATSLISVVQSSPGTDASAFVPLITAFSSITVAQAESLINVVQQSPSTPANSFVSLLVSFTVDPVVAVQTPVVAPPAVVAPTTVIQAQPVQQPTFTGTVPTTPVPVVQTPVPPVVVAPVPQGVTEQVGYNLTYEQRVVRDTLAEANTKCTNGQTDPTCLYLYGQATDFQTLANLVQSQWSTHRNQGCDENLSSVYDNLEQTIVGYYMNMTNLVGTPHTVAFAQGMQSQYLSDYQTKSNAYLAQAQSISSTCFGVN